MPSRIAVLFVFLLALAPGLRAQDEEPRPDPAARVQKAIDDYQPLREDKQKAAQRKQALLWLGELDHPLAQDYLQQELRAVGDDPFAVTVLEAIAKVARPALQPAMLEVLHRPAAPAPVRSAAAAAIVRLGDRGVDAALEVATSPPDAATAAVRDAVVGALIDHGGDRAHRGLAPLLTSSAAPDRLKLLRRMDAVRGVPPVSVARIKLVQDGDLETAAVAWRQLVAEKHERARSLTVDVLERVVETPKPAVAAELIGGLVRVQDADFYPTLLRFGSVAGEVVKRALRAAAGVVAEDRALVSWLVTQGLDDPQPAARDAAQVLLSGAPPEAVQPLVERIRADLRAGKKKALELASALHELLAKDPSWLADLTALANGQDFEGRMLGLSMLRELGADAGIPAAQHNLGHRQWEMRSLCYRYLARCRDVTSIPLLIARHGKEEGRLAAELDQALFVHTGTRRVDRKDWERWWQKNQAGFLLPHVDTVRTGGSSSAGSAGSTIAYHDIPIVSTRLYFVVDRSGSMKETIGTDKKTTRLDGAKDQLVRVVEALTDQHHVNLVTYESGVQPLWEALERLTDERRAKLLAAAKGIVLGGGTNIFDALEFAFADPKVDTIYLLTDGEPTAGRIRTTDGILEEVRRMNRTRQIVIHCIGFGIDSALLKQLAKDSGGTYKHVR